MKKKRILPFLIIVIIATYLTPVSEARRHIGTGTKPQDVTDIRKPTNDRDSEWIDNNSYTRNEEIIVERIIRNKDLSEYSQSDLEINQEYTKELERLSLDTLERIQKKLEKGEIEKLKLRLLEYVREHFPEGRSPEKPIPVESVFKSALIAKLKDSENDMSELESLSLKAIHLLNSKVIVELLIAKLSQAKSLESSRVGFPKSSYKIEADEMNANFYSWIDKTPNDFIEQNFQEFRMSLKKKIFDNNVNNYSGLNIFKEKTRDLYLESSNDNSTLFSGMSPDSRNIVSLASDRYGYSLSKILQKYQEIYGIDNSVLKFENLIVDAKLLQSLEGDKALSHFRKIRVKNKNPPPPTYGTRPYIKDPLKPEQLLIKAKGCCLYTKELPEDSALAKLNQIKFYGNDLRIINLFDSSKVIRVLKEAETSGIKSSIIDPTKPSSLRSTQIELIFQQNKGKSIVVIGHVVKNIFLTGEIQIPVNKLAEFSRKYQVSLMLLGCKTESAVNSIYKDYVGTLSPVRANRIAEQLISATKISETWGDFLKNLSAEDIPLIINKEFMVNYEANISINKRLITNNVTIGVSSELVRMMVEGGIIALYLYFDENDS